MSVYANGRLILHKGDGQTHVAAPPDVCKTPSPGGPVPIPYVNVAKDGDLASGSKNTLIEGNSIALASSNLSTSTGDEPGTAGGGIVSSKTKGKLTWSTSSADVRVEGKAVVRFMDVTLHNGNANNTGFIANGEISVAYGGDLDTYRCKICKKGYEAHQTPETPESKNKVGDLRKKLLDDLNPHLNALVRFEEAERERFEFSQQKKDLQKAITELDTDPPLGLSPGEIAAEKLKLQGELATASAGVTQRNQEKKQLAKGAAKNDILKNTTQGYMMGVLFCRDHNKGYASHSGQGVTDGFKRIAEGLGYEVGVDELLKAEALEYNKLMAGEDKTNFGAIWDNCATNNGTQRADTPEGAGMRERGESWNTPGTCAAPKMIKKAGSHKPRCMTEEWFDPIKQRSVGLSYLTIRNRFVHELKKLLSGVTYGLIDFKRERMAAVFKDSETVPSCNTCQATLSQLSCEHDKACG
ncbi:MAG: DUF4150 domain-containing protein [Myxococcales bacterium]|nr:DUF4150 domain-containing protein [Myxococcales bacterium]